jgi:polyisoprenoid-binding protein YceI
MGIFQSNAGGAWDNAKKSFEQGVLINGEMFYKKSEPHKASVTGDTVGDPFKDTSGPSMNILIKLMSIVSLVIAPYIAVVSMEGTESGAEAPKAWVASQSVDSLKGTYAFDQYHSFVGFGIKHLLSTANGTLSVDSGFVNLTGDLKTSGITIYLNAKSINTQNSMRDEHLRKPEYFAADSLPQIKFVSSSIEKASGKFAYVAVGELTIKGVTKAIRVPFNYAGKAASPNPEKPGDVHVFEGEFEVNRVDFNIGQSNPVVGDEVRVNFSVEAMKK